MIEFTVPGLRIESEMNRHQHWARRKKRFDLQAWRLRAAIAPDYSLAMLSIALNCPVIVALTRIGTRTMDSDNLAGGFKRIRDELARYMRRDDGDPLIEWKYAQEKGAPNEYAIRVQIDAKPANEMTGF